MNQEQNCKHQMFERTVKLCNEHPTKVALNSAFKADKERLEVLLPKISQLSRATNTGNAHSETKLNAKADMIAVGLDVCTNLNGYGKMMGDATLMKMSKYTKSTLGKGTETEVLERCQNIADKARELVVALTAKRGMKPALLTNYDNLIKEYRNIKTEPRGAIQERSALIKELDTEFAKADTAFELMVGSAVNLKGEADEFLMRFEKAIIIIAPKTSATKINFIVENSVTKEKITSYTVESSVINVTRTPTAARALAMSLIPQKKAAKGEKTAKGEKGAGTDFTITSEGFEPVVLTGQKIKRGKVNTIKVAMVPVSIG